MSTTLIDLLESMSGCIKRQAPLTEKYCKHCGETKAIAAFDIRKGNTCKTCAPRIAKEYYARKKQE